MTQLKRVREIDGHKVLRPAKSHPNLDHWFQLRNLKALQQMYQCGTCWRSSEEYAMELHHRHYDTWGEETINDVIMLCESCHDGITESIRSRRRALGDQTLRKVLTREIKPKQSSKPKKRKVKVPKTVRAKEIVRSRRP